MEPTEPPDDERTGFRGYELTIAALAAYSIILAIMLPGALLAMF